MSKRKKQKDWLFVKYKRLHPEQFKSTNKGKTDKKEMPKQIKRSLWVIAIFVLINVFALLLAAIINPDIQAAFIGLAS